MTNGNVKDAAAGESPKGFVAPPCVPTRAKVAEGALNSFPEIVVRGEFPHSCQ